MLPVSAWLRFIIFDAFLGPYTSIITFVIVVIIANRLGQISRSLGIPLRQTLVRFIFVYLSGAFGVALALTSTSILGLPVTTSFIPSALAILLIGMFPAGVSKGKEKTL